MSAVLEAEGLGMRYGSFWALKECTFSLDQGHVTALVGPNGSGKSTMLELAVGLQTPSEGQIEILGSSPTHEASRVLPRIGFVAQEHPQYRGFSVEEMIHFGRSTNPRWDDAWARKRIARIGLPLKKKAGQLSGGQQAQLSLVLALAKHPDLLLLDEPIAGLDPLARLDFLQLLLETVAESGMAVLLSSHILGDLERVCDSLVVLIGGRVRLSDTIERVLESHRVIIGPVDQEMLVSCVHSVIDRSRTEKQVATLAKLDAPLVLTDLWTVHEPSLEEIVLGYLQGRDGCAPALNERKAV